MPDIRTENMLKSCHCCERRCGINRKADERGFCRMPAAPGPSKFFIGYGEEEPLNPAFMLYFPGCNLRCVYCTNREFLEPGPDGPDWDPADLAGRIDAAYRNGEIKVLQLLGGEPSVVLSSLERVVSKLTSGVPVVFNSNFCFSPETLEILREFVSFYVADLKFGSDRCAEELAEMKNYLSTVLRNLRSVPPEKLLIRHLQLGGHFDCCTRKAVEILHTEFPSVPCSFHELMPDRAGRCRRPTGAERAQLDALVEERRLTRWYPVLNRTAPEGPHSGEFFTGDILIRPDGSIAVQDVPEPVREILQRLWKEPRGEAT